MSRRISKRGSSGQRGVMRRLRGGDFERIDYVNVRNDIIKKKLQDSNITIEEGYTNDMYGFATSLYEFGDSYDKKYVANIMNDYKTTNPGSSYRNPTYKELYQYIAKQIEEYDKNQ
jgi:hypothetical protein